MVDLSPERYIRIEDLLERVILALRNKQPFGLTRWADSSNWIMTHGGEDGDAYRYREGYLKVEHWDYYRESFLRGVEQADVVGCYQDDWTRQTMERVGIDLRDKSLINPWCNRFINAYREWSDEVLGGDWTVALVGNHMPAYALWLRDRFPRLRIVVLHTASHWLEVRAAMSLLEQTKPQFALLSAGWYTSCLVGAAKQAGAVAFSYGFAARDHLLGDLLPNTEFPRGQAGVEAYLRRYRPGALDEEAYRPTRDLAI